MSSGFHSVSIISLSCSRLPTFLISTMLSSAGAHVQSDHLLHQLLSAKLAYSHPFVWVHFAEQDARLFEELPESFLLVSSHHALDFGS